MQLGPGKEIGFQQVALTGVISAGTEAASTGSDGRGANLVLKAIRNPASRDRA